MARHAFDPVSFFFGVIFGVLGFSLLVTGSDVSFLEGRWLWPVVILGLGLVLLVNSILASRADARETAPVDPEAAALDTNDPDSEGTD